MHYLIVYGFLVRDRGEFEMMKKIRNLVVKLLVGVVAVFTVSIGSSEMVKADAATDLIMAQQAQIIQQQAELQRQSMAMLQMYQAALLAQYQKAYMDQYNAAVLVQQGFATSQINALSQSYLLNAIQAQQAAQYESMINALGLEYKDYLMSDFLKNQKAALTAFKGYYGLR